MPRQPRFWYPGAVLHAIQRGNNRVAVFHGDQDRRYYLECLREASCEHRVAIHAYVLMTNHVHLLVSPGTTGAMPRMMQTIGRRFVGRFNYRHGRTGTLWEGRYRAALIESEAHLLACMRYIELNPVRAGMVASPASYAWSSHGANALGRVDELITPHSLYESLGASPDARQARYRSELMRVLTDDELRGIRNATQFEWALGGEDFLRRVEAVTGRRTARLPMGPRPGSLGSKNTLPSD
jgi:putative transposase